MGKIKLTKGELKRQRDALTQYKRYLPTLQLKKQQLQMEILNENRKLEEQKRKEKEKRAHIETWAGLLSDPGTDIRKWALPKNVMKNNKNIAGVELPVFKSVEFEKAAYDLFLVPLWVDKAIEELRNLVSLAEEINIIKEGVDLLSQELRVTAQRVNLFEKIKIPEAQEAIRLIKIYLGDQTTNAVGRSKIAKKKIEAIAASGQPAGRRMGRPEEIGV